MMVTVDEMVTVTTVVDVDEMVVTAVVVVTVIEAWS
jgi:hypothetical protein